MRYKLGTRTVHSGHEGSKSRGDDWPEGVWLEPGTILTLTKYYPADLPTGVFLGYDDDGKAMYDEGWPAWYLAEIVPGATIGIDEDEVVPA